MTAEDFSVVDSTTKKDYTAFAQSIDEKFDIPSDLKLTEEELAYLETPQAPQRWYQWFSPSDTKIEKKLIVKLDLLVLVYLFLTSFVKTLDSSAVSYAYVSGMKEDLKMFGNQLTYQNSCFMAGFIFGQIPLTMLGTKVPIHIYLPVMDCIWGIFTLALFKIKDYHQLYAIRFFTGLFGSFFFPFCQYILGSWYTSHELTKRSALYFCSSQAGSMAAGYIQAAAYKHLNGLHGLKGWQWLYILAFIITIPIIVYGYWTLPGLPEKQHATKLLKPSELRLARLRMIREGRKTNDKLNLSIIVDTIKGWRFWALVTFAIFFSQADGISSNSGLQIWLKNNAIYSVPKINTITTIVPAVTIVFSLLNGVIVDCWKGSHPFIIAYVAFLNMLAAILLTIWKISTGGKLFAFFLSGTANSIAAVLYSWANIICSGNSNSRALTLSTMNTLGNTFSVWVPLFVWRTEDAPRYLKGYAFTIALDAMMLILLFPLTLCTRRAKEP